MRALLALLVVTSNSITWARVAVADEPTKQQCVGANEAAQDQRRNGKLRSAKESLAICMASTCPGPVRQDCATRFAEIEEVIPTLVFIVRDATGRDVRDVRVTMDEQALEETVVGVPLAVDPGEHDFVFEAEGRVRTERRLVVREGDKGRRIPVIMPVRGVEEVQSAPAPSPKNSIFADLGPQRKAALGLGSVGVAALVVGSVFGLVAKFTFDRGVADCPLGHKQCSSPEGPKDWRTASDEAAVATVAFVGGAVMVAAGAALFFTAKTSASDVTVGPQASLHEAGVVAVGTW
jgi:hypothetical protein